MKTLVITCLALALCGIVCAAPSLEITKPPVTPIPSYTGPMHDQHAQQGQWFMNLTGMVEEKRTHEFHDNPLPDGGGVAETHAIIGVVSLMSWGGPGTPIMGFDILATVTNDTPGTPMWPLGDNTHGETNQTMEQYEGTLYDTKICAEFAIASNLPPAWTGAYVMPLEEIIAMNHSQLAWYCWSPDAQSPPVPPGWLPGDYYVPTWDLGDIPPGASASVIMTFITPMGIMPSSPFYTPLTNSYFHHKDILANRTTSCKISTWVDHIAEDNGFFPEDPLRSSNASVFHNIPEPGMIAIIGVVTLVAAYTRKM